jgi:uncharacterized membrane protein
MTATPGLGPVEYMIVAFPGSRFDGRIVPALEDLVESGTIRILDLVFVTKDADGVVDAVELAELGPADAASFGRLETADVALLNDEDLQLAGDGLRPGDSAAMLVWEDLWAARLAEALRGAGAEVVALDRVPHEVVSTAAKAATTGA